MSMFAHGKILFLDVDGVLNPYSYPEYGGAERDRVTRERIGRAFLTEKTDKTTGERYIFCNFGILDPRCVDSLRIIVEQTGADIVVNSSWGSEALKEALAEHGYGLEEKVIGHTGSHCEYGVLGYLERHSMPEEDFVVIDDEGHYDPDFWYRSRIVRVKDKMRDGLTMELAEMAIRLLT